MTEGDLLHEEPAGYGGVPQGTPLGEYLRKIDRALKRGDATEHTHRPARKGRRVRRGDPARRLVTASRLEDRLPGVPRLGTDEIEALLQLVESLVVAPRRP